MTSSWPAPRSRAPRTSSGRPGRTAAPTPPASAPHGSTATSTSPADPAPARLATWRRTRPARSLSGWRASTWSWRARRPGSPIRRRWSGWPACTARAGGLPRWRATRSPRRSAPRAPDRRRGTCTCSPSTPRSGSPPRNRTARLAGASNAEGRSFRSAASAACPPASGSRTAGSSRSGGSPHRSWQRPNEVLLERRSHTRGARHVGSLSPHVMRARPISRSGALAKGRDMTGALVDDRAAADVERRGGHGAGVVRGGEGGHVADVVEGRRPLQHGVPLDVVHDRLAPIEALGEGLGHPAGPQGQHADAVRPELGGQIAAEGLHGAEGDLEPSQVVAGRRVAVAAEGEDDP